MSEFLSERRHMTTATFDQRRVEMQDLLQRIAGPAGLVKARIRSAARTLGWSYSRTKDLWYADPRARVDLSEIIQARMTAGAAPQPPVEADLARLRSLEDEVAELRALMAATLERMEGAAVDPGEHLGARPGPNQSRSAENTSLLHRALAGGPTR